MVVAIATTVTQDAHGDRHTKVATGRLQGGGGGGEGCVHDGLSEVTVLQAVEATAIYSNNVSITAK